jgi:translation elongation factor EF-G
VVVVVNKIDRPAARPEWVVDSTYELFMDLGANDEQCEFPVVYASGVKGIAGSSPEDLADDLQPLFDMVVREVPPPTVLPDAPLQLLATNIDYDEHKGRIAIGRVTAGARPRAAGAGGRVARRAALSGTGEREGRRRPDPKRSACPAALLLSPTLTDPHPLPPMPRCPAPKTGTIRKGQQVSICTSLEAGKCRIGKVNELFVYDNFSRVPVDEVQAGDICALTGIQDILVGSGGRGRGRGLGLGAREWPAAAAAGTGRLAARQEAEGPPETCWRPSSGSASGSAVEGAPPHPCPRRAPRSPYPPARSARPSAARTRPTRCPPSRWRSPPCR